ncbi:baseplate J/gp47 family protein [Cellvibrio sp. OA-2007]|uniref:baseplate J/gp47 family protein n=1 Tax=Cellvibrio sp. OA-2007 TaxID=529823 RepID=UPI000781DFE0|nr:baseplate J/gp47 family protein [Cellvibrio sp. OA-2007]
MSDTHTAPTGLPLQLHVRDGMSRQRRYLPALEQNYFNVDEMSFAQLLTQLQDYARLVKLPGVNFSPEDIEQLLFARDEIVVMAQILALNIDDLERRFNARLQQEIGSEEWALSEAQNPASVLGLARLLDHWLCLLKHPQSSAGENLYGLIESVILGLAKELYRVHGVMPERVKQSQYFSAHFMSLITAGDQQDRIREQHNIHQHSELNIRSLYSSLLKAADMIQASARELLPGSMQSKNHDPALALRVAFATLYQKLQLRLNRFTLDFIDFYFTQVLQARPRPIQPDSVYLVFQPGAKERDIRLPKGTEFFAGIDSASRDIVYASDDEVIINDAQVEQLYSLFFPRINLDLRTQTAPHKTAEKSKKISARASVSLADGCWLNAINAAPKADKKTRDRFSAHPFFGAARNLTNSDGRASDAAQSARLGFAVASNVLLLREGQRHITVELVFEDITRQPWSKLNNILRYLPNIKDNIADDKAKFFAYFSKMFQLSLTTADSWLDIAEYKPAYSATDVSINPNTVRLSFLLPENSPAISAYKTDVHGDPLTTALPVLRFSLKENYLQYPYDILKQLVLKEVRIQVDVKGCHDLLLHNNIGQLSPLAPFAPFGPMPDVGSYFIVGHEETRTKQLTSLSVDVEWSSLPVVAGGFDSWYRDYLQPKKNQLFVAGVSVLADGRWQPNGVDNNSEQPLFNFPLKNGTAHLTAPQTLSAASAIPFYKAQDQHQAKRPFSYSPQTRSGLFKFTLQGPAGAFGHREYPNLLAEVLTHNTRIKHPRFARPIPNPPYTPEISAIRLNYSAVSILTLADTGREDDPCYKDQFFHLHPLGWEAISPLRHPRLYLLPQYSDDGSLFIGIAASEIQQLSLYFHLQNNSLPLSNEILAQARREGRTGSLTPAALVNWSYLSDNQWRPLNPRYILSDSTEGFMTSGIVTLTMPEKITTGNSIMPGDLYWLKVSANQALTHFSDLFSVYAQAVKVSWRSGAHPAAEHPMQLPPDTIKRTRSTIPGITGISQITHSFGGVPAENIAHLRTRISERLRHKNRALTPLDYEMLILEKFPQVYKVKCFANLCTDPHAPVCPGHLLIIPIAHRDLTDGQGYKPYFDGHLMLSIKEFIAPLTPSLVKISVENPVYEEIQVRCAVQFKKGLHSGRHQNLLNQALCDYLSPWTAQGNSVHFGWSVSEQEVKSFIHNLEYIEHVTDFSLLRIAPQGDGLFILDDTGSVEGPEKYRQTLKPNYAWSTAVPLQHHYLDTLDQHRQIHAQRTGVDELEVGSTFIIP